MKSGRFDGLLGEVEGSLLDIPGLGLNVSTPEIIDLIHESRKA